jgi:hypothetical protein
MSSSTSRTAAVVTGGRETDARRRSAGGGGDPSLADVALHRWRLLVALVLVGVLAGYTLASRQPDRFSAFADMFLETPAAAAAQGNGFDATRFTRNQADLINAGARALGTARTWLSGTGRSA